jgi:hypothetical protein
MKKFIIEGDILGAGNLTTEQLVGISQQSCSILKDMGTGIQWVESYVTADKIYCIYLAATEEAIREHAQKGGFPANRVSEIKTMIDPTTAST